MKKQKKQKNISFWIEMILNKQYFIHFGIKLFWLVYSFYMGKWFFNYQVEYIYHYLFRMLVGASKDFFQLQLR